ncbi:MAG: peptidoglycan-binding domain-containing protein [Burkholderiaceae bacterium]
MNLAILRRLSCQIWEYPVVRLNPFRFSRHPYFSRDEGWGQSSLLRRSLPYLVLVFGATLFLLTVAIMMWPGKSDGTAPATSGVIDAAQRQQAATRVGSDSQTQVSLGGLTDASMADVAGRVSAHECDTRRTALATESRAVDRFDLDAVSNLNVRIGLFNADCAPSQAGSGGQGAPEPNSKMVETTQSRQSADQTIAAPGANESRDRRAIESTRVAKQPGSLGSSVAPAASEQANPWNPTVLSIQSLLTKLGYQPGPSDGLMGKRTREAVMQFQKDHNLAVDGSVTLELLEAVLAAYPGRGKATVKTVANAESKTGSSVEMSRAPAKRAASSTAAAPTSAASVGKPSAVVVASDTKPAPGGGRAPKQSANVSQGSLDELNQFERQTVEWVCAAQGSENNNTAFDNCITEQIAQARETGKPNLATLTAFERSSIVRLCADARYGKGLAAYYECASNHQNSLRSIQKKPNLMVLSSDVRAAVRRNCDGLQFTESLPVYYRCVDTQVSAARR